MVYFDNASTTYPKPLETLDSIKKAVNKSFRSSRNMIIKNT